MQHSTEKRQCAWTRPHIANSSTRWMTKCIMTSKKPRGNQSLKRHNVLTENVCRAATSDGFTTLTHTRLKSMPNRITASRGPLPKLLQIAAGIHLGLAHGGHVISCRASCYLSLVVAMFCYTPSLSVPLIPWIRADPHRWKHGVRVVASSAMSPPVNATISVEIWRPAPCPFEPIPRHFRQTTVWWYWQQHFVRCALHRVYFEWAISAQ